MAELDGARLRESSVFSGLPEEDIATLQPLARHVAIDGGEWLFRQGDEADCFFVVLSGGLDLEVRTPAGTEHVVAHMGPGAVVGETSLLIGGQRSASAQATAPTVLLSFPDERLRELLRADSLAAYRIVHRLAQALAHRLRELDAHIAQMSSNERDSASTEDDLDRLRRIFFTDWRATTPRGST